MADQGTDTTQVAPASRDIVKVCYLVDDARISAARWAQQLGAGPFLVLSHIELAPFEDPSTVFDHSSAFGSWGNIVVELMEVHNLQPAALRADFLRPGLHHVTWYAPSIFEESKRLEELGWPVFLQPTTPTGMTFIYHDARAELGHFINIYEKSDFFTSVKKLASGWDGSNPVRDL
jgi:hypothetical protein